MKENEMRIAKYLHVPAFRDSGVSGFCSFVSAKVALALAKLRVHRWTSGSPT